MKFIRIYKTNILKTLKKVYKCLKLEEEFEKHKKNFVIQDIKLIMIGISISFIIDFMIINEIKNFIIKAISILIFGIIFSYRHKEVERNKKYASIVKAILGVFIGSFLILMFKLIFSFLFYLYETLPRLEVK